MARVSTGDPLGLDSLRDYLNNIGSEQGIGSTPPDLSEPLTKYSTELPDDPDFLEEMRAYYEQTAEEQAAERASVTDPKKYAGLPGGAYGYLGENPLFPEDNWFKPGVAYPGNGADPFYIYNSHEALKFFMDNRLNPGARFYGPTRRSFSSWRELQDHIRTVKNQRRES